MTQSEELKVNDILNWLKKLDSLTSEGAKVVHVKHLLSQAISSAKEEAVERERERIVELIEQYDPGEMSISDGFYYSNHLDESPLADYLLEALQMKVNYDSI